MICECEHSDSSHEPHLGPCLLCDCGGFLEAQTTARPTSPADAATRESTEAEHQLIERLARVIGTALIAEWDGLADDAKALPMHRAFLSAMPRATGQFLAAVIVGGKPATRAEIETLFAAIGDITRQTLLAELDRARDLHAGRPPDAPRNAVICPEPPGVM